MSTNTICSNVMPGQMSIFDIFNGDSAPVNPVDPTENGKLDDQTSTPVTKYDVSKSQRGISKEFGEHIGGSRRELFGSQGSNSIALSDMNAAERQKYITKDKLWKKPDYKAMADSGIPKVVVYGIKKIRDGFPAKPHIRYGKDPFEEQKTYVKFLETIRRIADGIETVEDLLSTRQLVEDEMIIDASQSSQWRKVPGEICGGNMTNSLLQSLYLTQAIISRYESEMKKEQFLVAKEDKIPTGYSIHKNNSDDTYFVAKGCHIIFDGLATYEEALKLAQGSSSLHKKAKKTRFVPPQLEHVERIGLDDVRAGKHVSGEDFLTDFLIRGGEFGNWLNDKDSQANLDMCYDAFCDLAKVWNCNISGISLGGKLAIAFGARGSGNAVAHYEPLREVINLTKIRGAGSLAHEMFHALDDILGKAAGLDGMFSSAYMNYRTRDKIPAAVLNVFETMLYKPLEGRYREETEFYTNSKKMDQLRSKEQHGYWSSLCEMFARAGACFVTDELATMDAKNDYLSGHSESCIAVSDDGVVRAMPQGEERARINAAFREMFRSLSL